MFVSFPSTLYSFVWTRKYDKFYCTSAQLFLFFLPLLFDDNDLLLPAQKNPKPKKIIVLETCLNDSMFVLRKTEEEDIVL